MYKMKLQSIILALTIGSIVIYDVESHDHQAVLGEDTTVSRSAYRKRDVGTVGTGATRGLDYMRNPRLNKGLAFSQEERQALGLQGLIPPRFETQEEQLERCKIGLLNSVSELDKYIYLMDLKDQNEKLFYRFIYENVEKLMPIVYTPIVGLACQKYGMIYSRPRGLFISIQDKGRVYEVLRNWPERDVRAIVVTDGERILGLGDLGAHGMGIPVGKMALYTALAGIKPHQCLPITLDVGTNNQILLDDPFYIGLRQTRMTGQAYDDFVDEFMEAVVKLYGQSTLIQFEDFGNGNAFRLLDKYREKYSTFNDDIQGTAAVAVAGLMTARRITGKRMSDHKILFLGAGSAALGIANLCVKAMQNEGTSKLEAENKIWMMDRDGLLYKGRTEGALVGDQQLYAKEHAPVKDLLTLVKEIKPTILIGVSTVKGAFTPEVLREMANNNDRPIIFALSNPNSNAECTAQDAYDYTDGRCIFSSGSPFPPVEFNGKTYTPGQGNNAYIFPGVALGIIASGIQKDITEDVFLVAAQAVADLVQDEDIERGSVYPPLNKIRDCSIQIATRIAIYAYEHGMATVLPEPEDKEAFIRSQLYDTTYSPAIHTV